MEYASGGKYGNCSVLVFKNICLKSSGLRVKLQLMQQLRIATAHLISAGWHLAPQDTKLGPGGGGKHSTPPVLFNQIV